MPAAAFPLAPRPPLARAWRWLRGRLWATPLLLALLFVAGVLLWARADEATERETERQTLITDALSTATQLRERLQEERQALRELAQALQQPAAAPLAEQPRVRAGLAGVWLGLTWLDAQNRPQAEVQSSLRGDEGQSLHLSEPVGTGRLVLRFSPALLLKRGVPWWLAQRYDVQLVDSGDQLIASLAHAPVRVGNVARPSYPVLLDEALPDVHLELTLREPVRGALRPLAWVLMAGFLPLSLAASLLLRRQMRQVRDAERAWRTQAAWRAAVEDSALVGLRARDADGRLLSVNRTFCEMVGWSEAELVGHAPPMPYWPPDALDEVMQRSQRSLAGQAPREGYEARWRHRSGRAVDVLVFESPLIDAQGQQVGWLGSILDITERKRLGEQEQRRVEALAQTARLTMLGEVASTLAHELNQPLTAIASYNAGVLNSLARHGLQDELVLGALKRLGEQAAQAGRVVQRIRHFLTRHEPQLEVCSLNPVIEDALRVLAPEFKRCDIQLEVRLAPDLPPLWADAVLVEQVLINLLRNAADALRDQPAPRLIRVLSRSTGAGGPGFVRVEVSDNGPGLAGRPPETLFAPFYSTKPEGMGMGLAICRSIIEAHHGALDADTSELGGARFAFTLSTADE